MRPDLFDAHTLHWHGFRNVIPFFDGEPTGSVSVPAGTVFRYVYRPRDPGTYMYHCHVEDVEHVQMGMTGIVFVRPQNGRRTLHERKYLYNDGDGRPASTGSTRCSCRRCGPRRTGPTPTSSSRNGATTTPTSPCSTVGCTRTPSPRTRPTPAGCDARRTVDEAVHAGRHRRRRRPAAAAGYEHLQFQPLSSLVSATRAIGSHCASPTSGSRRRR